MWVDIGGGIHYDPGEAAPETPIGHTPRRVLTAVVPPPPEVQKTPDTTPSYQDPGSYITRQSAVDVTDTAEDKTCYVVYGFTRLRPWVVMVESAPPVFRFVFLVSEGPIDSYTHIYYENQEIYPTATVSGVTVVETRTGTNAQAKITECAAADWISNHPGKALICVEVNTAVAPMSGGQPDIMVECKGLLASLGPATTNLLTANQSDFQADTTGVDSGVQLTVATALTRITTDSFHGRACLSAAVTAVNGGAELAAGTCPAATSGVTYSCQATFKAPAGSLLEVAAYINGSAQTASTPVTATGGWQLASVSVAATAGATSIDMGVRCASYVAPFTILTQCWQIEANATATRWTLGGTSRTVAYTQNPVVIAYDMLTNVEYGASVPDAFISVPDWYDAAARCDELVNALPRWQANFILQQRTPPVSVIKDFLAHTCGARMYAADGQWHITFDDQHVIGNRATPDTEGDWNFNRAQSFLAPGPRIRVALLLHCVTAPTAVTVRLRSTLAGSDLATSTKTVQVGTNQETLFDEFAGLTPGATYYLVINATANISWYVNLTDQYAYGSSWYYSGSWLQQPTYDFWFQVHYCDAEIVRWKDRAAGQIPAIGSPGKSSLRWSRSHLDAPNVVTANYLDVTSWAETPISYELPGIQGGSQARRALTMGTLPVANSDQLYRLVKQWAMVAQKTLTGNIDVMLHGACLAPGDVVSLFPTPGVAASSWFRVRSISTSDAGYTLELYPYVYSDFSRDETYTAVAFTIPSAVSAEQYQIIEDDFRNGLLTDGYIGEQGWGGGGYISGQAYTSEANHSGIFTFAGQYVYPYNAARIGTQSAVSTPPLIASGGLNYYRWIVRCKSGNYGFTIGCTSNNLLKFDRAADLLYKFSGGGWVSLGFGAADAFVTLEIWGNGAGGVTCKVSVAGGSTAQWTLTGGATSPTENWSFAGLDGRGAIAIDDVKYATSTTR